VAELEQLTLDPLVSPAVVLGGEALDQSDDLGADRRSSRAVRVGLLLSYQAAVPPQDSADERSTMNSQADGTTGPPRGGAVDSFRAWSRFFSRAQRPGMARSAG
jgi:hypothetical protein